MRFIIICHRIGSHLGDRYRGITHPIDKDTKHQYRQRHRHRFQVKHKIGIPLDFEVEFDRSELHSTKKICKVTSAVIDSNSGFQHIPQLC